MPTLPKRLACALTLWIAAAVSSGAPSPDATSSDSATGPPRHPLSVQAESRFFEVFNHSPDAPEAPLRELMTAYYVDPEDARTNLLLGLNHLWLAAEGDRQDPRVIEHLYLAETFLVRTQARSPEDARLPSWLLPTRMSLAAIEQDDARVAELAQQMVEAYASDPNFHAFVIGQQSFRAPRDSERFRFGLEAMRAAGGCAGSDDPTCGNHPHWPHNVEAFMVLAADFELKAGEVARARAVLEEVRQVPGFATWPYRSLVDTRLKALSARSAAYANDDPEDDPPSLFHADHTVSCRLCHAAHEPPDASGSP